MALLGEHLDHQVVERLDFLGQVIGGLEAFALEGDGADHLVVGQHHGDGPEERLEVVGELCSASVAGVHRDEDRAVDVEADLLVVEVHAAELALRDQTQRVEDVLDVNGDHGQDLDLDSVELVEAAPRARLREAFEHRLQRLHVESVRAVEDVHEPAHVLAQVFDRLGLAGARRALGRAALLQVHRGGQGQVAPVCERRDDQAAVVALVLPAEEELGVGLGDLEVLLAGFFVEDHLEPQLLEPVEVCLGPAGGAELVHDVSVVDHDDDHRVDLDLHQIDVRLEHDVRDLLQVLLVLRLELAPLLLHRVLLLLVRFAVLLVLSFVDFIEGGLDGSDVVLADFGPLELDAEQDDLPGGFSNEGVEFGGLVLGVCDGFEDLGGVAELGF